MNTNNKIKKRMRNWIRTSYRYGKNAQYYLKNPKLIKRNIVKKKSIKLENIIKEDKRHCFFGYYEVTPWDPSERYLLYLSVPFLNKNPTLNDEGIIKVFDLEKKEVRKLCKTSAWNWQMGCRSIWLENVDDKPLFIYNDYRDNKFVSVIRNLQGDINKVIPYPIYSISHRKKKALSLNYERLNTFRPGYGYISKDNNFTKKVKPEEEGIYNIDLETGSINLILSINSIMKGNDNKEVYHWINHIQFNPNGTRAAFLHRFSINNKRRTHLYTINPDGTKLYCLSKAEIISRYDWINDDELVVTARLPRCNNKMCYYIFKDKKDKKRLIGKNKLVDPGHPSVSPDNNWLLIDSNPDVGGWKNLILYNLLNDRIYSLGKFYTPMKFRNGPTRNDLHSRWNRKGNKICVDSTHEGKRNLYVLDVSFFLENKGM